MPYERLLGIAALAGDLISPAAASVGELEAVDERLCAVFQFVEAPKVKVDGASEQLLQKAALAPVEIDFYLARKRLCLFEVDAVLIARLSLIQ